MVQSTRRYWCTILISLCSCQTPSKSADIAPKKHMFVVRETSICPTPALAMTRQCGNSVESKDSGYRLRHGERIEVSPSGSTDFVSSPRYLVEGKTPGFVRVDDLSVAPIVIKAELRSPIRADLRHTSISLVAEEREGDRYPIDPIKIQIGNEAFLLPPCLKTSDGTYFEDIHVCLAERDCDSLTYACDEEYCDTVLIEVNGPKITAIADRYGVFQAEVCDRYPE